MANPMLIWFVGYSNITSIIIVTFCFLAMTIFIGFISMNGDYSGRPNIPIGIEQRNMVKMSNPFFLQLVHQSRKLEDGLHLCLSSLLPSRVFVLWGAKIQPFHDFILMPGNWIQKTFILDKVENFRELDILHLDKLQFSKAGNHTINLQCPVNVSSESLGDMPRKRYPVAILIFILDNMSQSDRSRCDDDDESEQDESDQQHSIIGLISVIHLKDEKVAQNSLIINQYIKSSGVPIYSLQPLYLSTDTSQSHQNHQNARSKVPQAQSSSNIQPENLQNSNNINPDKYQSVSSASSVGENRQICLSCGHSLLGKGDSLPQKRGSRTSKQEATGFCDKCYSSIKSSVNDSSVEEQYRSSTNEGENSPSGDKFNVGNDKEALDSQNDVQAECVVCQTHQVKCALLPCRHACVCLSCFKLLYRCPLCRASIESYFLLQNNLSTRDDNTEDDEEDNDQNESGDDEMLQNMQHQAVNARFYQMWERFNTRLNNFLGFR